MVSIFVAHTIEQYRGDTRSAAYTHNLCFFHDTQLSRIHDSRASADAADSRQNTLSQHNKLLQYFIILYLYNIII